MKTITSHSPLELAIRYACVRAHLATEAEFAAALPTTTPRRSNRTRRISERVLVKLQMESAAGAWADGIREAA